MLAVHPLARSCPAGRRRGHRAPSLQMGCTGVTEDFIAAYTKGSGTLEKLAVGQLRRQHGPARARQTRSEVRAAPPAAIPPRPAGYRTRGLGAAHYRPRLPARRSEVGAGAGAGVTP